MKKLKIILILIVILLEVVSLFSGLQGMIKKHEETHATINRYFNVETASMDVSLLGGKVTSNFPKDWSRQDARDYNSLQAVNELVSYQFMTFYLLVNPMIAGILIIVLMMWLK